MAFVAARHCKTASSKNLKKHRPARFFPLTKQGRAVTLSRLLNIGFTAERSSADLKLLKTACNIFSTVIKLFLYERTAGVIDRDERIFFFQDFSLKTKQTPPPPPPPNSGKTFSNLDAVIFKFFHITQRNSQHVRCSNRHGTNGCGIQHSGRSPPRLSSHLT